MSLQQVDVFHRCFRTNLIHFLRLERSHLDREARDVELEALEEEERREEEEEMERKKSKAGKESEDGEKMSAGMPDPTLPLSRQLEQALATIRGQVRKKCKYFFLKNDILWLWENLFFIVDPECPRAEGQGR